MSNIPKIIHYCWFGHGELNKDFDKCIESWKKYHPDYIIKKWDETNFDLSHVPDYVKQAYESKCYAIVSDYARAKIVYENGGWYLDTDVEILKSFFDNYSNYNFVASIENNLNKNAMKYYNKCVDENKHRNNGEDGFVYGVSIIMSMFGAIKNCKYLKDVIEFYNKLDFKKHDYKGCLFAGAPIGPQIYARCLEPYGFVYDTIEQHLDDNILITGTEIIRNGEDENTYDGITCAVHKCTFSWFINFLAQHPKAKVTKSKDGKKEIVKIKRGIFRKPKIFTLIHEKEQDIY